MWTAFAVLAVGCPLGQIAVGNESENSNGQLWLVSTRDASTYEPSVQQTRFLKYWRHGVNGWQQSNKVVFFQQVDGEDSATRLPLCIYVHENRVSASEAFSRAVTIHGEMLNAAPPGSRFNLVLISWPSDQIGHRQRPDVQIKAERSELHAYYLAWLVDQIDPQVPLSIFGHSYGPRMITAALHLLGGGTIDGRELSPRVHPNRPPLRVALFASALDSNWLLPGQHNGKALSQVDDMLISFNRCDPVLRWYPWLYRRGGPPALGYVGMCTSELGSEQDKVQLVNVSCSVGKSHGWQDYEGSPQMMSRIVPYLLRQSDRFE